MSAKDVANRQQSGYDGHRGMRLSSVLKKYRAMSEKSVRDMAQEIGISFATLSRIERGEGMDGTTLSKILTWLMEESEIGKARRGHEE